MTTNRTTGYRYDRDRTVKEDAALIRADIKSLVKAGMLPTDVKISVRFERASMCKSIDIRVDVPRPIYLSDPSTFEGRWTENMTDEARSLKSALEDLHEAYNHDGSDSQSDLFDVKFYGQVSISPSAGVEVWAGGRVAGNYGF